MYTTRSLPEAMLACPTVFAIEDTYQIFMPFSCEVIVTVRVGATEYYDDWGGIFRSNTGMHRVDIPMTELDTAKEYTVFYRKMIQRKPYFPVSEEPVEITFPFRPLGDRQTIRLYHIADAHNLEEPVIAAGRYFGDAIDLLVLNGDIPNHSGKVENFNTIYKIASAITGGSCPVIFARGNHDTRGICAELFGNYTPTCNGRTYYTFRLGSVWGLVLDCGEDKDDSHEEYGHTVCFHRFRQKETEFLRRVIANAETEYNAPGIKTKLVISHIPFTGKNTPPFDIEQELYTEWARLLREEIKPDLMLHGHLHLNQIRKPGCEQDHLGQPCTAIIGSMPYKKEDASKHFVGCGIILEENQTTVIFNDDEGSVRLKETL